MHYRNVFAIFFYPKLSRPPGSDTWYRFSELGGKMLFHCNVSICCLRRIACAMHCLRLKQIVVIMR